MGQKCELTLAFLELQAFLKANPELLEFQLQIERELDRVGQDPILRLQRLSQWMHQLVMDELLPNAELLEQYLQRTKKLLEEYRKIS